MNKKYYLNSAIVVLLMALFRFIPPIGSMTTLGMTILGIFLGALWGWITCDMIWPSVLALVMLGFQRIHCQCFRSPDFHHQQWNHSADPVAAGIFRSTYYHRNFQIFRDKAGALADFVRAIPGGCPSSSAWPPGSARLSAPVSRQSCSAGIWSIPSARR